MIDRQDIGSWMDGPPPGQDHPGQRLGRPAEGPGSIARLGRRVIGLCIDWGIAMALAWALLPYEWVNLGIIGAWFAMTFLAVGATGHTIGHFALGMQVQTLDGRPIGMARGFVRTFLTLLVIPALLLDQDQRGFSDRLIGTVLVRIR
ncbi:RDD family protein [Kocuria palustris]|uniref:RDD family protein n=1 Tax=Kocuria palustris TaxID=71999 RepID=UPI0011A5A851|nr:RDD family protein [Kocuria palustris]